MCNSNHFIFCIEPQLKGWDHHKYICTKQERLQRMMGNKDCMNIISQAKTCKPLMSYLHDSRGKTS